MSEAELSRAEWEEIYIKLYAYADDVLKQYRWFRRTEDDTYLQGKTPDDYVQEAIKRYLEHPEKFNPGKRTLVGYLKKHILRSLIGNDARCEENRSTKDKQTYATQDGEELHNEIDDMIPGVVASI